MSADTITNSSSSSSEPRSLYLFGNPARSLAPVLHNTVFASLNLPWTFSCHETADIHDCLRLMRLDDFVGAAITIPYKIPFLHEMDEVTDVAKVIGAINTVFVRPSLNGKQRRYIGTNTDCVGVREALLKHRPTLAARSPGRKSAVVVGSGGAARAAIYALWRWLGFSTVYLVNRDEGEIHTMVAAFAKTELGADMLLLPVTNLTQARSFDAPAVIVSTVPDRTPETVAEKLTREIITTFLDRGRESGSGGLALDMCYRPKLSTEFVLLAQKRGWETVLGTEVMIYQAVDQDVLWTQRPVEDLPLEEVARIVTEAATG